LLYPAIKAAYREDLCWLVRRGICQGFSTVVTK
jgi:hypothetical protein